MTVHFNNKKSKELYYNGNKIKEAYYNGNKVFSGKGDLYHIYCGDTFGIITRDFKHGLLTFGYYQQASSYVNPNKTYYGIDFYYTYRGGWLGDCDFQIKGTKIIYTFIGTQSDPTYAEIISITDTQITLKYSDGTTTTYQRDKSKDYVITEDF